MSDEELSRYLELPRELRELVPAEEPKTLPGTRPISARKLTPVR
jgi:hypothetical protein